MYTTLSEELLNIFYKSGYKAADLLCLESGPTDSSSGLVKAIRDSGKLATLAGMLQTLFPRGTSCSKHKLVVVSSFTQVSCLISICLFLGFSTYLKNPLLELLNWMTASVVTYNLPDLIKPLGLLCSTVSTTFGISGFCLFCSSVPWKWSKRV